MSPRSCRLAAYPLLLMVMALTVVQTGAHAGDPPKQELVPLTYAQLGQFVHDNQGKVVYVDFWQMSCPPCKASMPDLARLQEKYGSRGFVAVVVNMDDPADAALTKRAAEWLAQKDLTSKGLTHFLLNETPEVGQKLLDIKQFPRGYLFDRAGRIVHKSDEALKYDSLGKEIEELLEKK